MRKRGGSAASGRVAVGERKAGRRRSPTDEGTAASVAYGMVKKRGSNDRRGEAANRVNPGAVLDGHTQRAAPRPEYGQIPTMSQACPPWAAPLPPNPRHPPEGAPQPSGDRRVWGSTFARCKWSRFLHRGPYPKHRHPIIANRHAIHDRPEDRFTLAPWTDTASPPSHPQAQRQTHWHTLAYTDRRRAAPAFALVCRYIPLITRSSQRFASPCSAIPAPLLPAASTTTYFRPFFGHSHLLLPPKPWH